MLSQVFRKLAKDAASGAVAREKVKANRVYVIKPLDESDASN